MKILRTYRVFNFLRGLLVILLTTVLLGSQFPLSSHCYTSLFSNHSQEKMACMIDGVCTMGNSGGPGMNCDCHTKHGDRPFYCSCDGSESGLTSGIQLNKMLVPINPEADCKLHYRLYSFGTNELQTPTCSRDIFHPPQFA